MKWSKRDVERFERSCPSVHVDSIDGNILVYSYSTKEKHWVFQARLLKGGEGMRYTVHFPEDHSHILD
jgi:hypothetical protein